MAPRTGTALIEVTLNALVDEALPSLAVTCTLNVPTYLSGVEICRVVPLNVTPTPSTAGEIWADNVNGSCSASDADTATVFVRARQLIV